MLGIGVGTNNEGLCKEKPDKRVRLRFLLGQEGRPEARFLPSRAARLILKRFWSQ